MKIIAHINKSCEWIVSFNPNGLIDTSKYGEGTRQRFNIPIFRARIQHVKTYYNNSSLSFVFAISEDETDPESVLRKLRGDEEFNHYTMTDTDAIPMLSAVFNGDNTLYKRHSDGYIEGVFAFKKSGRSINIYPYTDPIHESNTHITLNQG